MATIDTKRLRQKLLDLAVRGKLVQQDPNDGPASVLLERIRKERHELIAAGKIKAPRGGESVIYRASDGSHYEKRIDAKGHESEPACIDDEIPFEIPESWEWVRLGNVAYFSGGATPDKNNPEYWNGDIPWASMKDIHGSYLNKTSDTITERGLKSKKSISMCQPGQIIVSTRLVPGKTIISNISCAINQDLKIVHTLMPVRYLVIWFWSHLRDFQKLGIGTTVPGIKLQDLESALIPIPPLEEQSRIVTALDKYLGLVDIIKNNSAELEKLYDTLRAKVLDLAIRGKLVPQDPSDEPASVLLERIRKERHELIKEGKIKAPKGGENVIYRGSDGGYYEKRIDVKGHESEPVCIDDEIPFEIPESWEWARLGSFSNYGDASSAPAEQINDGSWILDLEDIEKSTGRILTRKTKSERFSLSTKRPFKKGQLLYSKLRPYLNKVLIADSDGFCTSEIMPISLHCSVCPNYIRYCMMSNYFLDYANQCAYGCKMPRLGVNDGKKALIPLPSLEEQSRIVAKTEQVFQIM